MTFLLGKLYDVHIAISTLRKDFIIVFEIELESHVCSSDSFSFTPQTAPLWEETTNQPALLACLFHNNITDNDHTSQNTPNATIKPLFPSFFLSKSLNAANGFYITIIKCLKVFHYLTPVSSTFCLSLPLCISHSVCCPVIGMISYHTLYSRR